MTTRETPAADLPPPERPGLDPRQKKILVGLAIAAGVVLLAVLIAALGRRSPDEPIGLPDTTTSSAPTTSLAGTSTSAAESTTTSLVETTTSSVAETTTSAADTTTTTNPAADLLTLEGDGLGPVSFGDRPEVAVAALTGILGPPDEDGGWVQASSSPFGVCPGEQVRGVRWRTLLTLYSDGDTAYGTAGNQHFFSYVDSVFHDDRSPIGLETEEGIGLGHSRRDLVDTYGDRVEITEDEVFGVFFQIEVPEPAVLWGDLSDSGSDALITSVRGGNGCAE